MISDWFGRKKCKIIAIELHLWSTYDLQLSCCSEFLLFIHVYMLSFSHMFHSHESIFFSKFYLKRWESKVINKTRSVRFILEKYPNYLAHRGKWQSFVSENYFQLFKSKTAIYFYYMFFSYLFHITSTESKLIFRVSISNRRINRLYRKYGLFSHYFTFYWLHWFKISNKRKETQR